jgi:hypothetical protein
MQCGELYTYTIDGRVQRIRKEYGHYVCFSEPVLELVHLQEHTFQVLKHTIEHELTALEEWLRHTYPELSAEQRRQSISAIQAGLVDLCLLPSEKRAHKQGVDHGRDHEERAGGGTGHEQERG